MRRLTRFRRSNILGQKHGACLSVKKEGYHQLDYVLWRNIKTRCYNENYPRYKDYGGRGIRMYNVWKVNFPEFAKYIRTLENCPNEELLSSRLKRSRSRLTIDRIRNNEDYTPGNLKWSTVKEQNNKRNNHLVIFNGETLTLTQAIEKYAVVCPGTAKATVVKHGWPIEKALLTPSRYDS